MFRSLRLKIHVAGNGVGIKVSRILGYTLHLGMHTYPMHKLRERRMWKLNICWASLAITLGFFPGCSGHDGTTCKIGNPVKQLTTGKSYGSHLLSCLNPYTATRQLQRRCPITLTPGFLSCRRFFPIPYVSWKGMHCYLAMEILFNSTREL
jgi:hypothetical protein